MKHQSSKPKFGDLVRQQLANSDSICSKASRMWNRWKYLAKDGKYVIVFNKSQNRFELHRNGLFGPAVEWEETGYGYTIKECL